MTDVESISSECYRMTSPAKKRLFNVIRIVVCVAALAIVVQGVTIHDHVTLIDGRTEVVGTILKDSTGADPIVVRLASGDLETIERKDIAVDDRGAYRITYGLVTTWRTSSQLLLLLALAIHSLVVFPQSLRFQWMLRAQDISVSFWECFKLSLAGNFLNFATPLGSNAGDVAKAYFVSLHTDQKTEAVTTVFLDRVIGLTSLLLVVAAITALSPSGSPLAQFRPYVLGMLGAGALAGLIYLSPTARKHLVPRKWLSRLPMFEQLRRIDKAACVLAANRATIAGTILLTIVLQGIAIGAYFTIAMALGMVAHLGNVLEYYTYFYTGVLIQALPGPPQGLGTVELAYRYFLAPFGSPSQIVCVAFAIRVVVLACALPGLAITVTGSYKPRRATAAGEAGNVADPPQFESETLDAKNAQVAHRP